MSLIGEIAKWADAHSAWMSDGARRLVQQKSLSESDVDDLHALIKLAAKLDDPSGRQPVRVNAGAIPSAGVAGSVVSLAAIREPKNLNAIGESESVTFEPVGLNVVYGYNGSGKSGYARALKRACSAREVEDIYPNIFVETIAPPGPASAMFEWVDSGMEQRGVWVDGTSAPSALSQIAVFDSHCARVFVDEQAEIAFIPYGMDMLTQMTSALVKIQQRLEAERRQAKFDRSQLEPLAGNTEVGRLISTLNRKTKPELVRKLATLSEAENDELNHLRDLLQNDVALKQAKQLRLFATRLESFNRELKNLSSLLGDDAMHKMREKFKELHALHIASQLAANAFSEGFLPGTGTEPWEQLLKSAINFAQIPYGDDQFPGPDGASCVLCQQPLSAEAHSRLKSFLKFLNDDSQARLAKCRKEVNEDWYQPVASAPTSNFAADKVFVEELAEKYPEMPARVAGYVGALRERQQRIIQMAPTRVIGELPPIPLDPSADLDEILEQLRLKIAQLEEKLTPEQQAEKAKRVLELEARLKLQPLIDVALLAIAADEWDSRMGDAIKLCHTGFLTKKHSELYEKTVTADLQRSMQQELGRVNTNSNY